HTHTHTHSYSRHTHTHTHTMRSSSHVIKHGHTPSGRISHSTPQRHIASSINKECCPPNQHITRSLPLRKNIDICIISILNNHTHTQREQQTAFVSFQRL